MSALSRNGKELHNVDRIKKELQDLGTLKSCVLDGELYADTKNSWNDTASVARSSVTKKDDKNLKFCVFDYIPMDEFEHQQGRLTLLERKKRLKEVLGLELVQILHVPFYVIKSAEEAWDAAKKFRDQGYEGAVAKQLSAVYVFDYASDWLKLKFTDTLDLKVTGFKEGTGKNVGRLGALLCQLPNGGTVQVGGGYSDAQRDEFWKVKETLIDRVVEVEFQEMTKDGNLLFPQFLQLREDK